MCFLLCVVCRDREVWHDAVRAIFCARARGWARRRAGANSILTGKWCGNLSYKCVLSRCGERVFIVRYVASGTIEEINRQAKYAV